MNDFLNSDLNCADSDNVEKVFFCALERLQSGSPQSEKLKAASANGRVKINVSTLCIEAGYHRTYLYKNRDKLWRVWENIESYKASEIGCRTTTSGSASLRARIRCAENDRDIAIDTSRCLLQEMLRARDEIAHLRKRLQDQSDYFQLKQRLHQLETNTATKS